MRLLLAAMLLAACAAPPTARTDTTSQHWLLVIAEEDGALRVVRRQLVDAPLPVRRSPSSGPVRVSVRDEQGRVLYEERRQDPRFVRAELPGAGGGPALVPPPGGAAFLLRVPVLEAARSITLEPSTPGGDFPAMNVPLEATP